MSPKFEVGDLLLILLVLDILPLSVCRTQTVHGEAQLNWENPNWRIKIIYRVVNKQLMRT